MHTLPRLHSLRISFLLLVLLLTPQVGRAQEHVVQHKPYLDLRRFHYGFFMGGYGQSFAPINNALVQQSDGAQWYATNDRYDVGFTVGVLGEWRLSDHFSLRLLPSLYFGSQHLVFRNQTTTQQRTQDLKTVYVALPLEVKFAAPRFNNYRPYLMAGLMPAYNLTRRKQDLLLTKPLNVFLELGMGCDFYLPFFKLIPELKFCIGLHDLLERDRRDLVDHSNLIFTQSITQATSNMVVLTLYFE